MSDSLVRAASEAAAQEVRQFVVPDGKATGQRGGGKDMLDSDDIVFDYLEHAKSDYVGLWQIANRVSDRSDDPSSVDLREITLRIVKKLMAGGLYPGDYTQAGFAFWRESPEHCVDRIDRSWVALGGIPDLANPICWFAIRPEAPSTGAVSRLADGTGPR